MASDILPRRSVSFLPTAGLGDIDIKFTGGKSYEDIIAAGGSWNELRSDTPRSGVSTGEVSLQLAAANIC